MTTQALLAGTLCLMSCDTDRPKREFAGRIVDNLRQLAYAPEFSAELRTVCARLAERWQPMADSLPADSSGPRVTPVMH